MWGNGFILALGERYVAIIRQFSSFFSFRLYKEHYNSEKAQTGKKNMIKVLKK